MARVFSPFTSLLTCATFSLLHSFSCQKIPLDPRAVAELGKFSSRSKCWVDSTGPTGSEFPACHLGEKLLPQYTLQQKSARLFNLAVPLLLWVLEAEMVSSGLCFFSQVVSPSADSLLSHRSLIYITDTNGYRECDVKFNVILGFMLSVVSSRDLIRRHCKTFTVVSQYLGMVRQLHPGCTISTLTSSVQRLKKKFIKVHRQTCKLVYGLLIYARRAMFKRAKHRGYFSDWLKSTRLIRRL